MKQINTDKKAFTLVEIAVVLAIIGLIGALGFSASRDMIESARYAATQNKLDVIEKALNKYWLANGRLPCPADATLATNYIHYGIEANDSSPSFGCEGGGVEPNFYSETNVYKSAEGAVPVVTLGLPRDFIYDGWKRKIVYAVSPHFTFSASINQIPPKSSICFANTAISIKDISGGYRSTSAAYALLSYGRNGHGGYLATGGTRYNAGSVNTDELANCHCSSTAADTTYDGDYVQRSQNLNERTPANYFDDIVRYKEGWQLTSDARQVNYSSYLGPDLAVGYIHSTNGTVYTYKNQCSAFIKQSSLDPLPTNQVRGVAYTAGNKHLLVYSALGCNLYKINNNGTLTNLPNAFSTACPYNATAVMELSNNGYLAISSGTSSATIKLWKQAGDQFIALPDLTHSAASVSGLSFSFDAKMLAVRSATNTSRIYRRLNDSFTASASYITQPVNMNSTGTPRTVKFSPDGYYLFSLEYWSAKANSLLLNWRVLGDNIPVFNQLTSFMPYVGSTVSNVTFSQDGKYFAIDVGMFMTFVCPIYHVKQTCTPLVWHAAGYYWSYQSLYAQELIDDSGAGVFAFSRFNDIAVSRDAVGNVPDILRYLGDDVWYRDVIFQTDGTTGATPVRSLDQVLSGSSGGPLAFAK